MLLELETTTGTRIASGSVFKRSSTSPFASNLNMPMDDQINFLHGDAEPVHCGADAAAAPVVQARRQ